MSHFVGFVFGSNVDELLEPYDENMVVDAYVRYTKDEAVDEVKRRHADNYEYTLKVLDKYQDPKSDWEKEQVERANKIIEGGIGISYEDAWEEAKKWDMTWMIMKIYSLPIIQNLNGTGIQKEVDGELG